MTGDLRAGGAGPPGWRRRQLRAFGFAARFLTRAPLPDPGAPAPGELGRAALFYPLVGLGLGGALGVLAWSLMLPACLAGVPPPALLIGAVLLFGWVWGTGALHLDGLGDCADAWVGGLGSRERTFEILKDPRSGAMAVVALMLVLLVKFAALATLVGASAPTGMLAWTLIWVPALARAQLLLLALTTPYARPTGMGAALRGELPRRAAWWIWALSWGAAFAALPAAGAPGASGIVGTCVAAAALPFTVWRRSMLTRLGGFTGDTAGALVEFTETALLLGLALAVPLATAA